MPQKFDELLGANMIFAPAETVPHFSNEVLKLHQMNGKTFVGWLFGGIKADIPNITPSSASKRLFKVYITPKNAVGTADVRVGSPSMRILPNPFFSGQSIRIEGVKEIRNISLFSAEGVFLGDFGSDVDGLGLRLEGVAPGVYFLQVVGENGRSVGKVIKP